MKSNAPCKNCKNCTNQLCQDPQLTLLCSLMLCSAEFSQGYRTILNFTAGSVPANTYPASTIPVALVSRRSNGTDQGTVYFTTYDNRVRKVRTAP